MNRNALRYGAPVRAVRAGVGPRVRRPAAAWLALAVGLAAGCAARAPAPPGEGLVPRAEEALIITRAGGEAVLTWRTRPGRVYTLMVKDAPGLQHEWRPVPGFERIEGDGREASVSLPSAPGDTRRFNVASRPARSAAAPPPVRPPALRRRGDGAP